LEDALLPARSKTDHEGDEHMNGRPHAQRSRSLAGRIAASVCDEDGGPVFAVGDITGAADPERGALDGRLTVALLAAIFEVNNLGKTKSSPALKSSGTKSPSRSAPRSRKPRKE